MKKLLIYLSLFICMLSACINTADSDDSIDYLVEKAEWGFSDDNFMSSFEQLYSLEIRSIEFIYPPDNIDDLGYLLSDGILYEVNGVFNLTSNDGWTGIYLYCTVTHPLSVPDIYFLLPLDKVTKYSEETKDGLVSPVFLKEGAVDIEGNKVDDLGYWAIRSISEDGVYHIETHGGYNVKVFASELEYPDVDIYGVCNIDEVK